MIDNNKKKKQKQQRKFSNNLKKKKSEKKMRRRFTNIHFTDFRRKIEKYSLFLNSPSFQCYQPFLIFFFFVEKLRPEMNLSFHFIFPSKTQLYGFARRLKFSSLRLI